MSKQTFYTFFNRPPRVVTELDYDTCHVSQSEADMCSLAAQLQRFGEDGLLAKMQALQDKFGYADCTKIGTFADIQNKYRRGVEYFEALPSEVRAKFGHRPEAFYDYIQNNQEQAIKDGYIKAPDFSDVDVPDLSTSVDTDVTKLNNSQTQKTPESVPQTPTDSSISG